MTKGLIRRRTGLSFSLSILWSFVLPVLLPIQPLVIRIACPSPYQPVGHSYCLSFSLSTLWSFVLPVLLPINPLVIRIACPSPYQPFGHSYCLSFSLSTLWSFVLPVLLPINPLVIRIACPSPYQPFIRMTKGLIGRRTGNTNDQRVDREKDRQYE
jgi:hypothetical protein